MDIVEEVDEQYETYEVNRPIEEEEDVNEVESRGAEELSENPEIDGKNNNDDDGRIHGDDDSSSDYRNNMEEDKIATSDELADDDMWSMEDIYD